MSQATTKESLNNFAESAIPLLREYNDKLNSISDRLRQIWESFAVERPTKEMQQILRTEYERLGQLVNYLQPAATQLAREVSQRIEHSGLDDMPRLELRLRLAEFEHAITVAQQASSNSP